jgi:hypothetical protein
MGENRRKCYEIHGGSGEWTCQIQKARVPDPNRRILAGSSLRAPYVGRVLLFGPGCGSKLEAQAHGL